MVITVQNYTDAEVHTIKVGNRELFWVKMIDVQNGLDIKNISDLVRKEMQGIFETKRAEKELDPECNSNSKSARSDLMEKIIKNCRGVKKCKDGINKMEKEEQRENFRIILGFRENDIMLTKEQSVLKSVMDAFEGENMQTQYIVLGYRIDANEKGHKDRIIDHEIQREKALEKELGCKFIRINPDEEKLNIFRTINEIHRHN